MRMRGASILRRAGDHPEAHTVPFPPPSEGPRSSNRCPAQRDGEDRSIVLLEIVIAATTNVSFAKSLATDPELGGGVRPFFRAWITVGLPPPKRVRSTASRVLQGGARPPYLGDRAAPVPAAWRWRWECSC